MAIDPLVETWTRSGGERRVVVEIGETAYTAELRAIVVLDFVPSDAQQPRSQRRLASKAVQTAERADKNILYQVVHKVSSRSQPLPNVRVQNICVAGDERSRGFSILAEDRSNELTLFRSPRFLFHRSCVLDRLEDQTTS